MSPHRALSFSGAPVCAETIIRSSRVTDHALVRWLERVEGLPVDEMRRAILSRPAVLQGLALGATGIQLRDLDAHLVIVDRRIVTVRPCGDFE